jgi:PPOX class probable FMN-dependent enzyme
VITTVEQLEAIYGTPAEPATVKAVDRLTPEYRKLIEASPFCVVATAGPDGLDCSPRGDATGFVRIQDDKTLLLPDRRGNNRVDTLRNIIADPRIGLLFLIPGSGTTLRVNGRASLSVDPTMLDTFRMQGKAPRSVMIVSIDVVYFQCARAILRSDLWNADRHVPAEQVPTPGQILSAITDARVGGEAYDKTWPQRAKDGMW